MNDDRRRRRQQIRKKETIRGKRDRDTGHMQCKPILIFIPSTRNVSHVHPANTVGGKETEGQATLGNAMKPWKTSNAKAGALHSWGSCRLRAVTAASGHIALHS